MYGAGVDSDRDLCVLTIADNPVEAGALRAYLEDNGIFVYVQGEHHSSMLGQYGSFLIELNVMVPRAQLELARDLVVAFREGETVLDDDELDPEQDVALAALVDEDDEDDDDVSALRLKYDLRQVTGYGCLGFGLGHFRASAPGRGLLLAATYLLAFLGVGELGTNWLVLIPVAMVTDVLGARARVRELHATASGRARLPSARVVRWRGRS